MYKEIDLVILTPMGRYFSGVVEDIKLHSDSFFLEITPNHSPLITSLIISEMTLTTKGKEHAFAIGGGVFEIKNGKAKMLLNSIEAKEDINVERAQQARKRAEERLLHSNEVDTARAKLALKRALNRIEVHNK